ncbi:hypothetical protein E2C01_093302 [Portunus trituberculatus]|uniref:Uncharacterized protein n=1 Tax=Portunus trituberculatus TaxID=210409 RepID=A0A5B7JTM0_PORTR|nr:hypothetical protein [Portunus trituberculatus]
MEAGDGGGLVRVIGGDGQPHYRDGLAYICYPPQPPTPPTPASPRLNYRVSLAPLPLLLPSTPASFNHSSTMTRFHIHSAYYLVILHSFRNLRGE